MKKEKEALKEQKEIIEVQFDTKEQEALGAMTDALVKAYGWQDGGQWIELTNWLRQKVMNGEKKNISA